VESIDVNIDEGFPENKIEDHEVDPFIEKVKKNLKRRKNIKKSKKKKNHLKILQN